MKFICRIGTESIEARRLEKAGCGKEFDTLEELIYHIDVDHMRSMYRKILKVDGRRKGNKFRRVG